MCNNRSGATINMNISIKGDFTDILYTAFINRNGQLRYTHIDQNLQLHVTNTFQFTNSSRTTKRHQL